MTPKEYTNEENTSVENEKGVFDSQNQNLNFSVRGKEDEESPTPSRDLEFSESPTPKRKKKTHLSQRNRVMSLLPRRNYSAWKLTFSCVAQGGRS